MNDMSIGRQSCGGGGGGVSDRKHDLEAFFGAQLGVLNVCKLS